LGYDKKGRATRHLDGSDLDGTQKEKGPAFMSSKKSGERKTGGKGSVSTDPGRSCPVPEKSCAGTLGKKKRKAKKNT